MKTLWLTTVLALLPLVGGARSLKTQGLSVEDIVPADTDHESATGDLNKDGLADLVVVATTPDQRFMEVGEDGDTLRLSQPLLAIYFGTPDGMLQQWRVYDDVMPLSDGCVIYEYSIDITDRGILRISVYSFSTAGTMGNTNNTYVYRYQDGDFYLIGQDQCELVRSTGRQTTVSENYLTHKRQTVEDNAFDDSVKPREWWEKLPVKPLERMGFPMDCF